MTIIVASLAAAAVLLMTAGEPRRLVRPRAAPRRSRPRPGVLSAAAAGVGTAMVIGGGTGAVAGVAVSLAVSRWQSSLPTRASTRTARRVVQDLPLATDLLASCLAGGASPAAALAAVGAGVSGPLGGIFLAAARRWELTGSVAAAMDGLAGARPGEPAYALAAACARAERSGAAAVDQLTALAADLRDTRRTDLEAAARRAGVYSVAPLGLCFLPAFVLLGVVPLVAGLLRGMPLW